MKYSLKELRARNNMKQQEVADKLGVTLLTYWAWEKLDKAAVKKLAAVYKVDPKEITVGEQ